MECINVPKVKIKAKTESSIGQPIYGHKDKEDMSLYICGRKKKKKNVKYT
jgi:hypothetical protein